jgi:rhomboid family GlyGly-CTERM serine protease
VPTEKIATPSSLSRPWFTLGACAFAVGAWFWPGSFDALVYDRGKILGGELWRVITGHYVHFSGSHVFWNLVVLLPAGCWLERRNPSALRWTLAISPLAIGLALLVFDPSLRVYAGISGVAAGVLVALAVNGMRTQPATRLWWIAVLALFAVKVTMETRGSRPINPDLAAQGVRSVPLAHLVGAVVGAGAAFWRPRK